MASFMKQAMIYLGLGPDDSYTPPADRPVIGDLPPPAEQRFVERATDCLLDRIGEDGFGARELAVALGVSEKTLGRRLKQARDVTPAAFIRSVRLNFARDLIRLRRHGTVAEIAHAAGFAATGHFSKLYREEFGQLPRDALRAVKAAE